MPDDTDMMPTMECTASPEQRMSFRVVRMGNDAPIVTCREKSLTNSTMHACIHTYKDML